MPNLLPWFGFALHLQPALVLPDNPENRGQAQARALPDRLGREKRLKDPPENVRLHPRAIVGEEQTDEFPVPRFPIQRRPARGGCSAARW